MLHDGSSEAKYWAEAATLADQVLTDDLRTWKLRQLAEALCRLKGAMMSRLTHEIRREREPFLGVLPKDRAGEASQKLWAELDRRDGTSTNG